MILVKIEDLKAGMILAQPVQSQQGLLLLDAGAKITKKNIRIFKSWGVNEIAIKGDLTETTGEGKPPADVVKESVKVELKKKFSDVLDNSVMAEIFKAASNQLIKNLQNKKHENENS